MRFLVDMPLSPELAVWFGQQGHDSVHALEEGLDRASDEVILERARSEDRVAVRADLDYSRLLALARADRGLARYSSEVGIIADKRLGSVQREPSRRFQTRSCQILSLSSKRAGFVVDGFHSNRTRNGIEALRLTFACRRPAIAGGS